jgi:hypothetical protein
MPTRLTDAITSTMDKRATKVVLEVGIRSPVQVDKGLVLVVTGIVAVVGTGPPPSRCTEGPGRMDTKLRTEQAFW